MRRRSSQSIVALVTVSRCSLSLAPRGVVTTKVATPNREGRMLANSPTTPQRTTSDAFRRVPSLPPWSGRPRFGIRGGGRRARRLPTRPLDSSSATTETGMDCPISSGGDSRVADAGRAISSERDFAVSARMAYGRPDAPSHAETRSTGDLALGPATNPHAYTYGTGVGRRIARSRHGPSGFFRRSPAPSPRPVMT